jgi:hypothetical protein
VKKFNHVWCIKCGFELEGKFENTNSTNYFSLITITGKIVSWLIISFTHANGQINLTLIDLDYILLTPCYQL